VAIFRRGLVLPHFFAYHVGAMNSAIHYVKAQRAGPRCLFFRRIAVIGRLCLVFVAMFALPGCGDAVKTGGAISSVPAAVEPAVDPVAQLRNEGRELFNTRCILCHQADGRGLPGVYPPLVGSPWLLDSDSKERTAKIVLYGLAGTIEVAGHRVDGQMPNFNLSDRQIAGALTYVRSAWSNNAPPVEEDFVAGIRAKCGNRGPWTPYEILAQHPIRAK
jgi:mono/diheme cytochrome c family protein